MVEEGDHFFPFSLGNDENKPISDIPLTLSGLHYDAQRHPRHRQHVFESFSVPFYHMIASVLFACTATLEFVWYELSDRKGGVTVYYETMERQDDGSVIMVAKALGDANVLLINASFLLITAAFHGYYAWYGSRYRLICSTRLRYLEYGIVIPIMFVSILLEVGGRELTSIVATMGLSMSFMIFGYIQDRLSGITTIRWAFSPHTWGYIPYVFVWVTISTPLFLNLSSPDIYVPNYTVALYLLQFFTLTLYGMCQYFYVVIPFMKGENKIDRTSQKKMDGCFHILSLVTKLTLVGTSTYGVVSGRQRF